MTREGSRLRRRGGRWVQGTDPQLGAQQLKRELRKAEKSTAVRRAGGKWVPDGEQHRERRRVLRAVGTRLWLLFIPFIGILWANSYYVRPEVEDLRSVSNRSRGATLDQQDGIRAMITDLQSEIHTISTELDTLYYPEINFHESLLSNVRQMRTEHARVHVTVAEIDSLRRAHDELTLVVDEFAVGQAGQDAILSNLDAWQAALQDSVAGLDRQMALAAAQPREKKASSSIGRVAARVGFVVAPVLGLLWAHGS